MNVKLLTAMILATLCISGIGISFIALSEGSEGASPISVPSLDVTTGASFTTESYNFPDQGYTLGSSFSTNYGWATLKVSKISGSMSKVWITGTAPSSAGTYSISGDIIKDSMAIYTVSCTLTVKSQVINYTHTLQYDANGGTGAPSSQSVTNTSTTTIMTISDITPVKGDYKFGYWTLTPGGTGTKYYPEDSISVGTSPVKLYAIYLQTDISSDDPNFGTMTVQAGASFTTESRNYFVGNYGASQYSSNYDWCVVTAVPYMSSETVVTGRFVGTAPSEGGTYIISSVLGANTLTLKLMVLWGFEWKSLC